MPLISSCVEELSVLSSKFSVVEGMMNYMSDTLKQISEAWEEILLEMDIKLASYASKLPKNSENGGSKCFLIATLQSFTVGYQQLPFNVNFAFLFLKSEFLLTLTQVSSYVDQGR